MSLKISYSCPENILPFIISQTQQLKKWGGTLSATVIVVGNGIGGLSSNPRPGCLCFTLH